MRAPQTYGAIAGLLLCCSSLGNEIAKTPAPEVIDLKFGTEVTSAAEGPAWFVGVEQDGGSFLPTAGGWKVDANQPFGVGKLVFILDRSKLQEDLALTLFYLQKEADLAIQLYDNENRVVAVDLFANVVKINEEAKTDTAIIPLMDYPTASKIVIRRLKGEINVQGSVLFPVVSQATTDRTTLQELAKLLGDPLSEKNPLMSGFSNSTDTKVNSEEMKAAQKTAPVRRDSAIKVLQNNSEVGGANRQIVQLRISGKIDGSEEIHISQQSASWVHKHWSHPAGVRLNDVAWNPIRSARLPNAGETRFLPSPVDFMSAKVLLAKGRDVCAMVPTRDKIIVFLSDSPNGASDYEMVIAFEAR